MLRINLNFFLALKEIEATQLRYRNEARLQQAKQRDGNIWRCDRCNENFENCMCDLISHEPYPREEA